MKVYKNYNDCRKDSSVGEALEYYLSSSILSDNELDIVERKLERLSDLFVLSLEDGADAVFGLLSQETYYIGRSEVSFSFES